MQNNKIHRVIIAGTRTFKDINLLEKEVNDHLSTFKHMNIIVVSGCADGADKLGEVYAKTKGYIVERYPAEWHKHGRSAGPIRNRQMASIANSCVVFWDGVSRGTNSMISECKKKDLPCYVVQYK